MFDTDEDLKAAAELAMENPKCSIWTVGAAVREHLGHRDALSTRDHAIYALTLVGTPRATAIIKEYKMSKLMDKIKSNLN